MAKSDSVHTHGQQHLGHTATTHCETAKGRPKQQAQFIFKSEFMVMSAFLKSMFNFDLGLLIVFVHLRSGDTARERSAGLT